MSDMPADSPMHFSALRDGYAGGERAPVDVAELVFARIERQKTPGIWTALRPRADVMRDAEALAARKSAGAALPLYGIPFAVKDNIDVAGLPTTAACPDFAYVPPRSAPAVEKLIEAGALLVGKT